MNAQAQYLVLSLCLMLGACSMFQTPAPETFNQSNAHAVTLLRSLNDATKEAYLAGYITPTKALAVNSQLHLARQTIATANDISATEPEAARDYLELALRTLERLQVELEAKQ